MEVVYTICKEGVYNYCTYYIPPFLIIAFQSSKCMAVLYAIYTPSLPFEVRCESGIYIYVFIDHTMVEQYYP